VANPKNKWDQPAAPPAPMFFGKKERDLVKQVNDELSERIIGQPIAYYPISLEESNFNDTYGEAIEKVSLPPIRVYAFVSVENEQTNDRYGYEYQTKLTINFNRRRLVEDQDLYVRVGDFVQYGDLFYEIVKTYNDTRYYFGQVEHKFQISAECVRARQGAFTVTPSVTRPVERPTVSGEGTGPAPRPAPYPPLAASYITVNAETKLPNERILTAGTGITLTDAGAGGALTINSSGQNAIGPAGAVQFQAGAGNFGGNANILFLTSNNILQVLGTVTASTEVATATLSSSNINLVPTSGSTAGLGSYLALDSNNNVIVTSSLGGASIGGIFTTINGSQAYVTSSLAIGGTTAPDHQVSVSGSVSASVNISASAFYGDGSNLSGVTTDAAGATTQVQFNSADAFAGSANLTFNGTTLTGSYTGSLAELTTLSASLMNVAPTSGTLAGAGSYLGLDVNNNVILSAGDGASTSPASPVNSIQFNNAGAFGGSSNLTFDGTTFEVSGGDAQILASSPGPGITNPTDGRLLFDKVFDNSGEATANKIVLYDDGGVGPQWKGGIGVSQLDVDFFSGDNFRFWTNHGSTTEGDNRFTILTNGNVGIGTDAPAYALDVAGTVGIDDYIYHNDDGDTYLKFAPDEVNLVAGGKSVIKLVESGTNDKIKINNTNADIDLQVMADDGEVILHTDAGTNRVGINTDAPTYALDVVGDAGFDEYIYHNGDTNTFIRFVPDRMYIEAGGENMLYLVSGSGGDQDAKATINNDGVDVDFQVKGAAEANLIRTDALNDRVGIGHSSPAGLLHVSSSNDNQVFRVDGLAVRSQGHSGFGPYQTPTSAMLFLSGSRGTDGSSRASLGIGTDVPQYALDVNGYITLGNGSGGGYILSRNDEDTYIRFGSAGSDSIRMAAGGVNFIELDENGLDWVLFNSASADVDFQVRTQNNTASLFIEGSTDRVGIGTSVPSHTLTTAGNTHLSGGLVHKRTAVAANYTASVADYILGVTAVPVAIEFDATSFSIGQVVVIKDESGAASSGNTILLNASASQTIDGDASVTIESPYGSVLLYSDGTNWFVY